ncbi:MAG: cytochrome c [Thermodesulfovibrionales bacterium]
MKKSLVLFAFVVLSLVLANTQAFAITGPCSGCHTMHNSQNGTVVNTNPLYVNGAPYLLVGDCYACHSVNGTAGILPKVDDPANLRAAGTFATAVATTDSRRHNVAYIGSGADAALGQTPPGNNGTALAGNGLTCAGNVGCHGNPSVDTSASTIGGFEAMTGYHHNSIAGGSGYRFLRVNDGTNGGHGTPVGGFGSADWELGGATAANHNVYQGGAGGNTISQACAKCHGQFHGVANTGAASPFTRHPVDRDLTAGMIANADVDYENNPFVFSNTAGVSTTAAYTTTNAQVGCVSCHRGHGSANPDLLRFDYTTQVAGANPGAATGFGCLGCHYSQR